MFNAITLIGKNAMRPPTWLTGNNRSHYGFALPVLTTLLSLPQTWALQVVAGSNCTTACLSTATTYGTNGSDITCHDNDYNSTVFGGAFKECVSCELESQTFDNQTSQTDLGWAFCKPEAFLSIGLDTELISLVM